jgi:hypothetical protein
MAISFDSETHASPSTTGSPLSVSFTHTAAGTNRIAFIGVDSGAASGSISGITYDGQACTKIGATTVPSNLWNVEVWYIVNPTTTTNASIVVTNSVAFVSFCDVSCVTYTGVNQGFTLGGVTDNFTTGQSPNSATGNPSITTIATNSWAAFFGISTSTFTANSNCLLRSNTGDSSGIMDSNQAITPAQTWNMVYNAGTGANSAFVVWSFSPATGGGGKSATMSLMGV